MNVALYYYSAHFNRHSSSSSSSSSATTGTDSAAFVALTLPSFSTRGAFFAVPLASSSSPSPSSPSSSPPSSSSPGASSSSSSSSSSLPSSLETRVFFLGAVHLISQEPAARRIYLRGASSSESSSSSKFEPSESSYLRARVLVATGSLWTASRSDRGIKPDEMNRPESQQCNGDGRRTGYQADRHQDSCAATTKSGGALQQHQFENMTVCDHNGDIFGHSRQVGAVA
ncbi:hypothetical protein P280DRAFT_176554 [Massarina eburnea CBS 473.64]|uniref:Uncharacterized protein n=1 Tax=Massarina eburnea CBS 473.64 TaxID=1395130 RepID=A0A6A6SAR7_9PLEO|nr:hypothetical protein P280DRAFT_176554 [Massarina eburnea CBS 473.64]